MPDLEKSLFSRKGGAALKLIRKVKKVDEVTEKLTSSVEYKQKIVKEYP